MRQSYTKIINDAFDIGIASAWGWWGMTPAEVNGRIRASGAERNTASENLDLLAWMIGHYSAKAYHEPNKYPKKQIFFEHKAEPREMDEDSMKEILGAYAEIHNAIENER